MVKFNFLHVVTLLGGTSAFAPSVTHTSSSSLSMSTTDTDRRSFFSKAAATGGLSFLLQQAPQSAQAIGFPGGGGGALTKINGKLRGLGFPPMERLPDGFKPLAEVWGKGRNRDPLLIQFIYPFDWIVTLPSQDTNGEDGTVQAGQYAQGDTATFYYDESIEKVDNIVEQTKDFFQKELIKAISQKGDNVYQNFKVTKIEPKVVNEQGFMTVDFKYDLLTGAGFEVERRGVASVTSVEKGVQILWCASTRQRYNKSTESSLREIADSFRVYAGGLDSQKVVYEEKEY